MKIIDLLNTPLNELPQKIKLEGKTYTLFIDEDTNYHYYQDDECKYFMFTISCFDELNDEVEIIEENKKIEKLESLQKEWMSLDDIKFTFSNSEMILLNKINEIIDHINGSEKE